jgi:hypothetical protein
LAGTSIVPGGRGPTAESIGNGSSPIIGSAGPQIEQVSTHDRPIDFNAFLAQQRVSKQESHLAAFETASWTAGRHGFILASDSAAS